LAYPAAAPSAPLRFPLTRRASPKGRAPRPFSQGRWRNARPRRWLVFGGGCAGLILQAPRDGFASVTVSSRTCRVRLCPPASAAQGDAAGALWRSRLALPSASWRCQTGLRARRLALPVGRPRACCWRLGRLRLRVDSCSQTGAPISGGRWSWSGVHVGRRWASPPAVSAVGRPCAPPAPMSMPSGPVCLVCTGEIPSGGAVRPLRGRPPVHASPACFLRRLCLLIGTRSGWGRCGRGGCWVSSCAGHRLRCLSSACSGRLVRSCPSFPDGPFFKRYGALPRGAARVARWQLAVVAIFWRRLWLPNAEPSTFLRLPLLGAACLVLRSATHSSRPAVSRRVFAPLCAGSPPPDLSVIWFSAPVFPMGAQAAPPQFAAASGLWPP